MRYLTLAQVKPFLACGEYATRRAWTIADDPECIWFDSDKGTMHKSEGREKGLSPWKPTQADLEATDWYIIQEANNEHVCENIITSHEYQL